MSENTTNKTPKEDEIDLLDLFKRMGRTLSRGSGAVGRAFLISFIFMVRKWVYLTLSIILGIGLSYLLKYASKSLYSSDMIISSNAVPTSDIISYVNKLHTFCRDNNKPAIAASLGSEPGKIKMIKDIQAFWIIDRNKDGIPDYIDYNNNHNVYDTINVRMQDRLAITVKTTSPAELNGIRDGIFRYINGNKLFEEQNKIRIAQTDEMLTRLNYDIKQLDSLQKVKYFEETKNRIPEKVGQMIFLQEQKTQLIYDDIYDLYKQKQLLDKQKEIFFDIITLLSDFTPPLKPENSASYYGKIIIPSFFGLCLVILILIQNRKKLNEVYNRY
jgi:hypothetical protein